MDEDRKDGLVDRRETLLAEVVGIRREQIGGSITDFEAWIRISGRSLWLMVWETLIRHPLNLLLAGVGLIMAVAGEPLGIDSRIVMLMRVALTGYLLISIWHAVRHTMLNVKNADIQLEIEELRR